MTFVEAHQWLAAGPWVLLAGVRWFGLLLLMPGLSHGIAPLRLKVGLAVLLGTVMLPAIAGPHLLNSERVPGWEWLVLAAAELATGAALGIGIRVIFAGLRVAGELIDHQAGLAMTQVLDPGGDESTTASGQTLAWVATAAFLCLSPVGGDLILTASMLDLFADLPAGSVRQFPPADLLVVLVHRSLDLAIRLAAPVLAVMSLVTIAGAWIGRSCAGWSIAPLQAPLRVVLCLMILAASLTGAADVAAEGFRSLLRSVPAEVLLEGTTLPSTAGVVHGAASLRVS